MELGYAFLLLAIYTILVLAGIWIYEYWEQRQELKKPVPVLELTDKEKRGKLNELLQNFGFAYDGRQNIFYAREDSWQRNYGYGRIFDEAAAPLNMIIDCEPVYFEYDNKKWLIEFWKGQYGMTSGGEIGVYYLPKGVLSDIASKGELIYRSVADEDVMRIQSILWKKGERLYYRSGYHWWQTGFVMGEFSKLKNLEMDIEITFKEMDMRNAFMTALYKMGYREPEVSVLGTTVWIHYTKPHSKQPFTRTRWFSFLKQMENKRNCRLYQKVTKDYTSAYEKLLALQIRSPKLWRKLERFGKTRFFTGEK